MRSWCEHLPHRIGALRRFGLAIFGVLAVGGVFHSWVAVGLVSRGDDTLRSGHLRRAIIYYQRAAWFDPGWQVPVERFGFAVTLLADQKWYKAEIQVASRYLEHHPEDVKVRWDRAVAYLHAGRREAAYRDMAVLARSHPKDGRMRELTEHLAAQIGGRIDRLP